MYTKFGFLGLSFLFLLSSQTVSQASNISDLWQEKTDFKVRKDLSNSQENLTQSPRFGVAENISKDDLTLSKLPDSETSNLSGTAEITEHSTAFDTISDVESVAELDTHLSTEALDLLVPSANQIAEEVPVEKVYLMAQDGSDESEVEESETEAEEAESTSGFNVPGDISATVTVTTNYVFRGISQTDSNPAIQGSFDYSVGLIEDLDFYAGIWGSNIDFGDEEADFGGASLGTLELDFYGGVTYGLSEKASVGGSIVYYFYPGADDSLDFNYIEFGLDAAYDFGLVSTTLNFAYSPDFFGGSDDGFYIAGAAEAPLPLDLTASAGLGFQVIGDNDTFGTPDYLEWNIGIGYSIVGFDLLLQYIDTDISNVECFGDTDLCSARVVFSASRTF